MTIDFLTREEVAAVPHAIGIFNNVVAIRGKRNVRKQLIFLFTRLPWLWFQRYDLILDLQNNKVSRLVVSLLRPKAVSFFDNYSPISAALRTQNTINSIWKWKVELNTNFKIQSRGVDDLLRNNGFKQSNDLIVLNPAGYCASRNWPADYYVNFALHWLKDRPASQFVLLLLPSLREKASVLKEALGQQCIDLTGKADQQMAFNILSRCSLILTEDSGLMHMAWIQGIPTIALFSSSRKDWSSPQGHSSYCFDSSDLDCGPCLRETCIHGDNRCLTRYSVGSIVAKGQELISIRELDLVDSR